MSRITRPSPAMVVALVALFVALGGTGYAALKVTGKNVKNRSLTGKDVKKNSLGGTEIRETKLAKVPSAVSADRAGSANTATTATQLSAQAAGAFFPVDKVTSSGVVKRAKGQEVTLLQKGPFRVVGTCADDSGKTKSELVVFSSEPNSVLDGADPNVQPAPYGPTPTAAFASARREWTLLAPSGPTAAFTTTQIINGLGTDCAFQLDALTHP